MMSGRTRRQPSRSRCCCRDRLRSRRSPLLRRSRNRRTNLLRLLPKRRRDHEPGEEGLAAASGLDDDIRRQNQDENQRQSTARYEAAQDGAAAEEEVISGSDVEATIRSLIPGFVALKVFYWAGIPSKRSDLEWTVWSVIVAVAINAVLDRLITPSSDPVLRLLVALAAGVILGFVAAQLWIDLARRYPKLRAIASRQAWDIALSSHETTPYVVVQTTAGHTVYGWPEYFASSAESDSPDVLVRDPEWVDEDGGRHEMGAVNSVLIPAAAIELIQVFELGELLDGDSPPSPSV